MAKQLLFKVSKKNGNTDVTKDLFTGLFHAHYIYAASLEAARQQMQKIKGHTSGWHLIPIR